MAKDEVLTGTVSDPKDYRIPGALLGVGVLIYLAWGFLTGGSAGLVAMVIYLPVRLIVQVILGVIACFITARFMGTSFGYLKSALVKLAAIFVFPSAATFFIPWVGGIIAILLYWKLLEWLFELEALETIMLAIVIWFVNIGAFFLVAFLGLVM